MTAGDPVCDCAHCSRARGKPDEAELWQLGRDLGAWFKLPETLYLAKCIRQVFIITTITGPSSFATS